MTLFAYHVSSQEFHFNGTENVDLLKDIRVINNCYVNLLPISTVPMIRLNMLLCSLSISEKSLEISEYFAWLFKFSFF